MLLKISHETRWTYSEPVSETVFEVRMAPQSDEDQTVLGYRLNIAPKAPVTSYRDGFGNRVDLFNVTSSYQELVVQATSYVRPHRRPGAGRLSEVRWPMEEPTPIEALDFLPASPLVPRCLELDQLVESLPTLEGSVADVARTLKQFLADRVVYEKRITTARTPVDEVIRLGRGVCQDFAHAYIGLCRALGVPARYVSGYINQPGEMATHAWCQIWGGEATGWVDIDPTHRIFGGNDHVVTAIGRDYADVPPNRGLWKGHAQETIGVTVKVETVQRMPPQWQEWTNSNSGQTVAWTTSTESANGRSLGRPLPNRTTRRPYPNQSDHRPILRQQQGQQQQ